MNNFNDDDDDDDDSGSDFYYFYFTNTFKQNYSFYVLIVFIYF